MVKTCLVIMHKEPDEALAQKIEDFHSGRFDKIIHLMPLYFGEKQNIINVYESKYQLSGYVAQAFEKIYNDEFLRYVFLSSDSALNPKINQDNINDYFHIDENTSFISDNMYAIDYDVITDKIWAFPSLYYMALARNGAEVRDYLPTKLQARGMYEKFGMKTPRIYLDYISYLLKFLLVGRKQLHPYYFKLAYGRANIKNMTEGYKVVTEQEKLITLYPLVASEAECIIVPKEYIQKFSYVCGLFAAVRVHYNAAFASALCFASEKITMPKDLNDSVIMKLDRNDDVFGENFVQKEYNKNVNSFFEENDNTLLVSSLSSKEWFKEV